MYGVNNTRTVCVRGGKRLGHCAEHRIVATDAGSVLIIVLLCVTHLVKLRLWREGERGTNKTKKHRKWLIAVFIGIGTKFTLVSTQNLISNFIGKNLRIFLRQCI